MNPSRTRDLEIFTEAVQLSPAERGPFLDRVCVGDADLRRRILALLSSSDDAGDFLETPPTGAIHEGRARIAVGEKPGDQIGKYKLLQQIGEGGGGVVFVAEQEQPIRRQVALKVVKPGMDTESVMARFDAERQALAMMDHPNIAKVFDAGATESGRPYFVMELVRGLRITDYCDEHQLSTAARLDLFIQVCEAVQHAHQKGIIHRDLKPSNVLVATAGDGKPQPIVIDFGIAKATSGQQLTDKTVFTAMEMLIGTPAYMSPEQADLRGANVDTRSDVYSLGVLLYELLTGTTPFDSAELLVPGLDEVRRVIREEEPVRPSTRLSGMLPSELKGVSQHRHTEPPKLIREVRSDLDWIVMKALEKDPRRRYATANGLALDVGRYLSSQPVSARPPSTWYQLGKLARRNRLLFGSLTVFVAMFVIGFVAVTIAFTREKKARLEADLARREAIVSKAGSDEVSAFLQSILDGVGPMAAMGKDTALLKDILDKTASRLDTELNDLPGVQADLRIKLAVVYREMRQFARSEALFRQSLETAIRLFGEESESASDIQYELALVVALQSREDEAEALIRQSLAVRLKLFGEKSFYVARCYEGLSIICWGRQQFPETEAMVQKSLAILRGLVGEDDFHLCDSLLALGGVRFKQGRYREAEELYRQAMNNWKKVKAEDHPTVVNCMHNLGATLSVEEKYEEAEALFRQCAAAYRKVFGIEHPSYAVALQSLTRLLNKTKRYEEAESTGREAFAAAKLAWGATQPKTLEVFFDLVAALRNRHKFVEIEQQLAEAMPRGWEANPEYTLLLKERLNSYTRRSRWPEAAGDARALLVHLPDDSEIYHALAPLLAQLGALEEYQKLCPVILEKFRGTTDMFVADRMAKDCLILPVPGLKLETAAALADVAVTRGAQSPTLPYFQFCKALAEFRLGHREDAIHWAELAAAGPHRHPKACAFAVLAMARCKLGQLGEARAALSQARQIVDLRLPKPDEDPGSDWRDTIILRALCSEAEGMIAAPAVQQAGAH